MYRLARYFVAAAAMLLWHSDVARSQERGTSAEIDAIFNEQNFVSLCGTRGTVDSSHVLGYLLTSFDINPFLLTNAAQRDALGVEGNASFEEIIAAWFSRFPPAIPAGMSEETYTKIDAARAELRQFLENLLLGRVPANSLYSLEIKNLPPTQTAEDLIDKTDSALTAFFGAYEDSAILSSPQVIITCRTSIPRPPSKTQSATDALLFALRGKIDDLSIGPASSSFKKISPASIAFNNNVEANTATLSATGTLGVGKRIFEQHFFYGFVHGDVNDVSIDGKKDNSSKDVRAVSPGVSWSFPLSVIDYANDLAVSSIAGGAVFPTYDFAQNSSTLRGRFYLNDIVFNLPGEGFAAICGVGKPFIVAFLYWNCSIEVFSEIGYVFDAGKNTNLEDGEDNGYFGPGGNVGFQLGGSPRSLLKDVTFAVGLRYLWLPIGDIDDAKRFSAAASYKVPDTTMSFDLKYENGENSQTFVDEENFLISLGLKF